MAARERMRLTDAAIARLRPREREYTVWDSRVPGLGVRVRPVRRAELRPVVRCRWPFQPGLARSGLNHEHRPGSSGMPRATRPPTNPTRRPRRRALSRCSGTSSRASGRRLISTDTNRRQKRASGPCSQAASCRPSDRSRLDRITPARLRRWFDAFSRTAPGNANHALNLLRQIMNFAVACGHIEKNPTQGIRPNRRPRLTRFLSREEIGRLHRVLDRQTRKGGREQADIIRLLLLTGCRKGEIVHLRWSEVHRDALVLGRQQDGRRERSLSTARLEASSNDNREAGAHSCSRRRSTRPDRAVTPSHSGIGSAARPTSRMSAFTTSAIPMRAMR